MGSTLVPNKYRTIMITPTRRDERHVIDYAIVGGGCSGLYCAWRLSLALANPDVYLFETNNRLGGRLLSIDLLAGDGAKAELGGMRVTSNQLLIAQLTTQLQGELPGPPEMKHPLV